MYLIDDKNNRISRIDKKTFSELRFREREHLQEWLANEPTSLGEELLIIQKEFDGFSETRERLDLLALDLKGNLVVIENKLDDSGRDVTWQALKYVSYCSSLSKEEIRQIYQEYLNDIGESKTAEDMLSEFYGEREYDELVLNKGLSQRIMLVASNFRKEVTSTVMWLMNYNIRIQCFKVTPYKLGHQTLLNIEQIIPVKDAEEYVIRMAEKIQLDEKDEGKLITRYQVRLKFWNQLLPGYKERSDLFNNISASTSNVIGTRTGVGGGSYNFVIARNYARVEVYFSRGEKDENEFIFDKLKDNKEKTEEKFGDRLIWERLDGKKATRIKYQLDGVSLYDENDWDEMIEFLIDSMIRLHKAFENDMKIVREELMEFIS